MSEIFKSKTYSLTDQQIRGLANICYREQGSGEAGVRACVSHMLNYYEKYQSNKYANPYECTIRSGWYGTYQFNQPYLNNNSAPQSVVAVVTDVIKNGNRSLPNFVDEYDCLGDVKTASNNGVPFTPTDRYQYKKDVTKVTNVYGSTWTFYCFPDGPEGYTDAFGYINKPSNSTSQTNSSASNSSATSSSDIVEKAVKWMESIAKDDSHGYGQQYRWGERGDYDCSSLTISAFKQAGIPLTCTYTGDMYADMTRKGFKDVTSSVNLSTGSGLKRGDVLLNHQRHVAVYCGNGKQVDAIGNENNGSATGGKPGDQTGSEILIRDYRGNYAWDCVLRYGNGSTANSSATNSPASNEYQYGDISPKVKEIQQLLNKVGYVLDEDGEFGELTQAAVLDFQKNNGLVADGVVGQKTLAKLKSVASNVNNNSRIEKADSVVIEHSTSTQAVNSQKSDGSYFVTKDVKYKGKAVDDNLNVRSGPGFAYANVNIYPRLSRGEVVDVCDTVKSLDGSDWLYIRINNAIYGFVNANYIQKM